MEMNQFLCQDVIGALELPTMLHLAAKYGFSELCSRLTDLPSVVQAYRLTDSSGWLPEQIAAHMGHSQLASLLETFREVVRWLVKIFLIAEPILFLTTMMLLLSLINNEINNKINKTK